ncbi:MAG: alanine racemase [Elusimicrobia bacterium]|nr:alanine racemase [Elusimicrobiota bacterium]MBD3412010.1 alanine racemase [Elusimicrobiota bacterium]
MVVMKHYPAPAKPEPFRPTWAEISTRTLTRNISSIQKYVNKQAGLLIVVKANAYGHGAAACAVTALNAGARYLGVSSIEEGIQLREQGITGPILILGSQYPFEHFSAVADYRLTPTVASLTAAKALAQAGTRKRLRIPFHFKIDTGMGRIGVNPTSACEIIKNIVSYEYIYAEGVYTHLACAESNAAYTKHQLNLFDRVRAELNRAGIIIPLYHAANSSAAIRFKRSHYSMVRIGLSAYGLQTSGTHKFRGLRPVLSWKTKIVFLKTVPAGTSISYCGTYKTRKKTQIATLPVGYADGYNRLLSNNAEVIIRHVRCPVIGRVTMDMIMVDVTRVKKCAIGDEVILIGGSGKEFITAEELATQCRTINYEIVCRIADRVPRIIRA